jgi:hypothetical protein
MQATSLVSLEGDGEEFFLDILFNRMSDMGFATVTVPAGLKWMGGRCS